MTRAGIQRAAEPNPGPGPEQVENDALLSIDTYYVLLKRVCKKKKVQTELDPDINLMLAFTCSNIVSPSTFLSFSLDLFYKKNSHLL